MFSRWLGAMGSIKMNSASGTSAATHDGHFHVVGSVVGSGGILVALSWPERKSEAYMAALRACVICLSDPAIDSDFARKAFLEAAKEAGVFIPEPRRG